MSRPKQDNSVHSIVSSLELDQECVIDNPNVASVAVMVSQLRKKEGMYDRKYKIQSTNDKVIVKRIK